MNVYWAEKKSERLFVIGECLSETMINAMQLIIGDERAALIDTGIGATGNLDQFVRTFTGLPVTVLCTHGDPDHIGSCSLFHTVYMSKKDEPLLDWSLRRETRLGDLAVMTGGNQELIRYANEHAVGEERFAYKDIVDGDVFDLGGVVLQAFALPGHSQGSMCFLDDANKIAYTGDSVLPYPWMWIDRCAPMSEYAAGLRRFQERTRQIEKMFCGHSLQAVPKTTLSELIVAADEIIAGKTQDDPLYQVPFKTDTVGIIKTHPYKSVSIVYNQTKLDKSK